MSGMIGQDHLRGPRLRNRQCTRHKILQRPACRRKIQRHCGHQQRGCQARPARRQDLDAKHSEHG